MVARVRPRFTDDLDIALVVPPDRADAFLDLSAKQGFSFGPKDREFFKEAGLLPMQAPSGVRVDVMIADDELLTATVEHASMLDVGGVQVPVASVEDLLLLKLDANRHVDLDDAIAIKDVYESAIDRQYVWTKAAELGLVERLEAIFGPR